MAAKKRKGYKLIAFVIGAALITGDSLPMQMMRSAVYAEETEPEMEELEEFETELETERLEKSETELEIENPEEAETERETEEPEEAEAESETKYLEEPETEPETGYQEETEAETETEQITECQEETETDQETEFPKELETEQVTEFQEEIESEVESERLTETEDETEEMKVDVLLETELESETTEEGETEPVAELPETTDPEFESEITEEMESESEPETELVLVLPKKKENKKKETKKNEEAQSATGNQVSTYHSFWDESWYVEKDFRFIQVEKEYGIVEDEGTVPIYETMDCDSKIVGEIPYFGMVYILQEESPEWYYIESGDVRGFLQTEKLADKEYTVSLIETIGEDSFQIARSSCEKADNEAFVHTQTTVQEVLAEKQYSLVVQSTYIHEYPQEESRQIGKISSGTLVYLLKETEDGWFFVESGDSRGFVRNEVLLMGEVADETVSMLGEEYISLAENYIQPEENRSCYFTLSSVKSAETGIGEKIAELALSYEGKLKYIWGGTSLTYGADCSGFVQSIYASFGIQIPRLAQEQGISGMEIPDIESAKPGDIVYWAGGPHVGIYIGNGQVVQCSGNSSNTAANPGKGVAICSADYQPITSIRRFQIDREWYAQQSGYSKTQLELIWAIVAQEDNGSYEGALAVISSAANRTESAAWSYLGSDVLAQLMAPGQYCYSMDNYWKPRLNGNVPDYVKKAVDDCLNKGIRNHGYTSFRSKKGSQTGADAVQIGGNWFFGF